MKNAKRVTNRLKNWIGLGFQAGIALSLTLIAIGFIMLVYISGFSNIQLQVKLEQIPAAMVISIGVLLLLIIPIIQVILSLIFFSISRNRMFIIISLAVFCLAAISLVLLLI